MKPFKLSLTIYRENFLSLLLLSFTIVFPILIFQSFLMNFLYGVTANIDNYAFADFVNAFLTLLFLLIAQIPFIQFTQSDQEGRDNPVKDAYMVFLNRGFSMYLFAIVFCLFVFSGLMLFIIPGLLILIFLFLTPYLAILKNIPVRKAWKIALKLGKKHFLRIFTLIFAISIVELVIESASLFGISFVTTNYPTILLTQMLLNVVFFPFIIIVITTYVLNWEEKMGM